MSHGVLGTWQIRYADEVPQPSAFYVGAGGREFPLWWRSDVAAWRRWMTQRVDRRVLARPHAVAVAVAVAVDDEAAPEVSPR